MSKKKLVPCPFCESQDVALMSYNNDTECDNVCQNCGCRTARYCSIEDANEAWNRRINTSLLATQPETGISATEQNQEVGARPAYSPSDMAASFRTGMNTARIEDAQPVAQPRLGIFEPSLDGERLNRPEWKLPTEAQTDVPEGYALVPINATDDEIDQACEAMPESELGRNLRAAFRVTFRRVLKKLAAALTPSQFIGKDDIWTSPVTPSNQSKEGA